MKREEIIYEILKDIPLKTADDTITNGTLVLEGGAFRGLYQEGVLDCLMEKGYNFNLDIYIPFRNTELKKFIDSEIISLFNKEPKPEKNTFEEYITFICKADLKYDYKLKNLPDYYNSLIFSDIFVKLVEKYKNNAEKMVEEYLINFKKEQINYMDKALNIFKKNVLN